MGQGELRQKGWHVRVLVAEVRTVAMGMGWHWAGARPGGDGSGQQVSVCSRQGLGHVCPQTWRKGPGWGDLPLWGWGHPETGGGW